MIQRLRTERSCAKRLVRSVKAILSATLVRRRSITMFWAWCVALRKACSIARCVLPDGDFSSQNMPSMTISGDFVPGVRDFWTNSMSSPSASRVLIVAYSCNSSITLLVSSLPADGLMFLIIYWSFLTWRASSSTGVSRPNMETMTLIFPFWVSISETAPSKPLNGPSIMEMTSPIS